jgi:cysteine-S-conjugate beta-lyase
MDFDRRIDRRGTHSIKWDNPKNQPGVPDIIPLWVADMDFSPPEAVLEAIRKRAQHPIFGYTSPSRDYFEAISAWYARRQGIDIGPQEIALAPAVMPAIATAIHAFTERGDGIMIMPPVYYPFFSVIKENDRQLVEAPLARLEDGSWELDFEAMARAADRAARSGIKLKAILFSSPHNPVGRVWTETELSLLLDFAQGRGLKVFCDEIHSDIILGPKRFTSLASIRDPRSAGVLVFSGPNKTFNIAGLHICQAISRDVATLDDMRRAISGAGFGLPNVFSLAAAEAAYREGDAWLDELLSYLRGNQHRLSAFLSSRFPELRASPLEGSYLAWLDFRSLIPRRWSDDVSLTRSLEEEGRVRLSPGSGFGKEGAGWIRLNLACPGSLLSEALERIAGMLS